MPEQDGEPRTAHYIRYEIDGEWKTAIVETLAPSNTICNMFNRTETPYEHKGMVEIPEADGEFVEFKE